MDKETFVELTGKNPKDVFGEDWENIVAELSEEEEDEFSNKE